MNSFVEQLHPLPISHHLLCASVDSNVTISFANEPQKCNSEMKPGRETSAPTAFIVMFLLSVTAQLGLQLLFWYSHNTSRVWACLPPFGIHHTSPVLRFSSGPSIVIVRMSTFPSSSFADSWLILHFRHTCRHTQPIFYKSNPLGLFSSHTVSIFFLSFFFFFFPSFSIIIITLFARLFAGEMLLT